MAWDQYRDGVRVLRPSKRLGIGQAKALLAEHAVGDVIVSMDGHHRVYEGRLDTLAEIAQTYQAIACPGIAPVYCEPDEQPDPAFRPPWVLRTAALEDHNGLPRVVPQRERGGKRYPDLHRASAVSWAVTAIPRQLLLERLGGWHQYPGLWGEQEAGLSLRAWFADVPAIWVRDVVIGHRFRGWKSGHSRHPYPIRAVTQIWPNTYYYLGVCFGDEAFQGYWLPLLRKKKACRTIDTILAASAFAQQHLQFQERKRRTDQEFFQELWRHGPRATTARTGRRNPQQPAGLVREE